MLILTGCTAYLRYEQSTSSLSTTPRISEVQDQQAGLPRELASPVYLRIASSKH